MLMLATIFMAEFLAKLGDKAQLATVLFATDKSHHPSVMFPPAGRTLFDHFKGA